MSISSSSLPSVHVSSFSTHVPERSLQTTTCGMLVLGTGTGWFLAKDLVMFWDTSPSSDSSSELTWCALEYEIRMQLYYGIILIFLISLIFWPVFKAPKVLDYNWTTQKIHPHQFSYWSEQSCVESKVNKVDRYLADTFISDTGSKCGVWESPDCQSSDITVLKTYLGVEVLGCVFILVTLAVFGVWNVLAGTLEIIWLPFERKLLDTVFDAAEDKQNDSRKPCDKVQQFCLFFLHWTEQIRLTDSTYKQTFRGEIIEKQEQNSWTTVMTSVTLADSAIRKLLLLWIGKIRQKKIKNHVVSKHTWKQECLQLLVSMLNKKWKVGPLYDWLV